VKNEHPHSPQGWTPAQLNDLTGKTYVITGANSGVGYEASRTLLSKGANVVMLNRSVERSTTAIQNLKQEFGHDAHVSFIYMDLAVLASVRTAAEKILQTVPNIDAIICNAAIAQVPKQKITVDGFESQLGVNHYGHFLLCGLLFNRIEASKGRIVVVSSLGYKMGLKTIQFDDMNWNKNYHQNNTYCHSKLAQMMFAYELQNRVKAAHKNVKIYVCHPGASATSLIKTSANLATRVMFYFMAKLPIVQTAEKGSYPEVMCATESNLEQRAFYGPTGRLEMIGPVGKGTLEAYALDEAVMKKLWHISEKATDMAWDMETKLAA